MQLPFKNPFETRMRRLVRRIKNGEEVKKPKWINKDVLEDIYDVVEYLKVVEKNAGSKLVFGILFGGIVRTPFETHAHSDIDLLLVYQPEAILIPPKNKRMSVIYYPEGFLNSMIISDKLESSFIRDTLLQTHVIVIGDEKKAESLRNTALQNFNMMDLVPLIEHRIRKSGLSLDENGIKRAMEMLQIAPWVFETENLNKIIHATFEAKSAAANTL